MSDLGESYTESPSASVVYWAGEKSYYNPIGSIVDIMFHNSASAFVETTFSYPSIMSLLSAQSIRIMIHKPKTFSQLRISIKNCYPTITSGLAKGTATSWKCTCHLILLLTDCDLKLPECMQDNYISRIEQ